MFVSCVHRRIVKDSAGCVVHVDMNSEWSVPAVMGLETWLVEQGVATMLRKCKLLTEGPYKVV